MDDFGKLCPGCGACKEVCPFLAEYGTPDRILGKSPEASFYCTSCRRCDGVCPQGLSPSAAFFEAKQRLVRQDTIPPPVRKSLDGARRFAKAGHGFPLSAATAGSCCGNGGGLSALHPALADRFLDRIMGEAANRTMVTYCTGCQNRFLKRGAEAVHLLECLPGVKPRRRIPSPLAQWVNRFALATIERLGTGKWIGAIILALLVIGGIYLNQQNLFSAEKLTNLLNHFLLNYLFGLTPIPFGQYLASTFVFMLPACIAFVAFGSSLGELVLHGNVRRVVIGVVIAVLAFLLPIVLRRFFRKVGDNKAEAIDKDVRKEERT